MQNVNKVATILYDYLFDLLADFNDILWAEDILIIHFLIYLNDVVFTVENDFVCEVVQNCVFYLERNVEKSLISRLKDSLNGPFVISLHMNSIQKIVIFCPDEFLNFFTDREAFKEVKILNSFIDVAFRAIFSTYDDG
jgi:hypothetical protein